MNCVLIESIGLYHYMYEYSNDILYQKDVQLSDELAALAESDKTMKFSQFVFLPN